MFAQAWPPSPLRPLDRGTAIVGAIGHQVGFHAKQGAAYVFVQSGSTWTQQAELTASDGEEGAELGFSVALSGGTAVVGGTALIGAPVNAAQGAAYVFAPTGMVATCRATNSGASSSGAGATGGGSEGDVAVTGCTCQMPGEAPPTGLGGGLLPLVALLRRARTDRVRSTK
jgi:hypothetical protein